MSQFPEHYNHIDLSTRFVSLALFLKMSSPFLICFLLVLFVAVLSQTLSSLTSMISSFLLNSNMY